MNKNWEQEARHRMANGMGFHSPGIAREVGLRIERGRKMEAHYRQQKGHRTPPNVGMSDRPLRVIIGNRT